MPRPCSVDLRERALLACGEGTDSCARLHDVSASASRRCACGASRRATRDGARLGRWGAARLRLAAGWLGVLVAERDDASGLATAARAFVPAWFVVSVANLWVRVVKAGCTVREKVPILLLVFAVPTTVAGIVAWQLSRS